MVSAVYAGALAAALFATGCGSTDVFSRNTDGVFAPAGIAASQAVTYDQNLVPTGSSIHVRQRTEAGGATTVELRVAGVKAGHAYGVHIHQKACGANPKDAGMHYQNEPGMDAAHVNDKNEVWLDFKADADGNASVKAQHSWAFRKGEAGSVVIHSVQGTKGSRAACFTVPFDSAS
ncbi:superoxide dismutase family protein [Streptomyces sp. MMG1121]|uniref:superoxide dismutase family protein n=1 Tax=Streptomyces sp. MMG1121 TaxID=1415544 RepID=UPI0006AE7F3D|nr:superoxide dismutase family protein [Streptomyces sp. MMG1121]KOV71103.1 superoxide dismutase [Streptomyces sp. MMG1121]